MNLHEFQAKQLFNRYGIPTPQGQSVTEPAQARLAAELLSGERWVIKAQVHTGGRGKAGGVKVVNTLDDVENTAAAMLGQKLITQQTTAEGLPINQVLVEKPSNIVRELYLAVLVDRSSQRIVFMLSSEGGMDIEAVAEKSPEARSVLGSNITSNACSRDLAQVLRLLSMASMSSPPKTF
ncbi:hypothetical protein LCGC14_2592600, partial [marine sediment metagenome]